MARSTTPADQIVAVITQHPGCGLDDVVAFCPELTWNQIFLEVDRLSRDGILKLTVAGTGRYTIMVPAEENCCAPQLEDAPVLPPAPARSRQDTQCACCGGLMVWEEYDDFNEWRCILCGVRVDPVILMRRQKSVAPCLRTVHASR
ncbi:MAG TPA: hypothetical protein DCQ94_10455 [Nitrospira sp.]|nr:hypothetical protein [Nitrospira sp.]